MAEINKLYEQLLPETQQRLTQDWAQARYSGSGDSARLNRFGISAALAKPSAGYAKSNLSQEALVGNMSMGATAGGVVGGAVAGASAGGMTGPVGAAVGGVAGAASGLVGSWWGQRKSYKWTPGQTHTGQAWEASLNENASTFAEDPYKTSLAMLFMSPDRGNDPYRFSREWATKRKGWNRRKVGRAKYWLDERNRPGAKQDEFVRTAEGFMDWKGYSGGGPGRYQNFAPTWIENMLSRSIYSKHRDLWDKESERGATTHRRTLDLANSDDKYSRGSGGHVRRENLGAYGG